MGAKTQGSRKRHPIQVVAHRTGLSVDVLRVWEKRYGVVEPARSTGGHRLYSDDDVKRLSLLNRATSAGRRISRVAGLSEGELMALVHEDVEAALDRRREWRLGTSAAPESHLASCLRAVEVFDAQALEMSLRRASVALAAPVLIEEVLGPLLNRIGENWRHGKMNPGQEHMATVVVRRVLESLSNAVMPGREAPSIVVATPAGQVHEFGALFVATAAATQGWRVTYLGPSLPAADIAEVVEATDAAAIAISLVFPEDDPGVIESLRRLRRAVRPGLPILVGGRAAGAYAEVLAEVDARHVIGLDDLYAALEAVQKPSTRF